MVVEVPIREESPDSMVHATKIWMIRPGSVGTRVHEMIDQCLQGGHILRPDRRRGVECLGGAWDLGLRPWEEVENELPHDWVIAAAFPSGVENASVSGICLNVVPSNKTTPLM